MKKYVYPLFVFLVILIQGCESKEGLYAYAIFEYTGGNGYFFGYFLDDWGRDVTDDVRITINDSRTFTPPDTSRYYLSEVFPNAKFKVKISHPNYPDIITTVEIPSGFTIKKFDGTINTGEKDTIIWEPSGESPQNWEILILNRENNFSWAKYFNPEDTMAIISSDIFSFSGTYQFILEELNFAENDGAASNSFIVGVFSETRNYTVNR